MKYNDVIEVEIVTPVGSITDEPDSLERVKQHLNLQFDTAGSYEFNDDDDKLQVIMKDSREMLERFTGLSLAQKGYKAILRNQCGNIEIPFGPITTITSVKDVDGNTLTDGTDYVIRGNKFKWIERPCSCYLEVSFTSGYTPDEIPEGLRRAWLVQIAWNYVNTGDQQQQFATANVDICKAAMEIAAPYKRKSMIA
jgi:uncharacterized phiE125 gp8 family phage protein